MRMNLRNAFEVYPRQAYTFIFASFVNAMGSAFMWPLVVIYVHTVLHRSYGEAGLVLMLQSLASVVGQWCGGALYYRFGVKRLLIGSLALCGGAQLCVATFHQWSAFLCLMTLMGFMLAVSMPVINAFIGFRWPEHRNRLFNVVYVSNNVGMAVGTTLGGLIAAYSFTLSFAFNGLSTLLFALFFVYFLRTATSDETADVTLGKSVAGGAATQWRLLRDYRMYLFVGVGSLLTWFSTSVYGSGIAPFLTDHGSSSATYSFLWTVNGIVILCGQPLLGLLNRTLAKTLSARLVASAACYATGFIYIALQHAVYYHLIIGMIITTFGEMLIAPTVPALVSELTQRQAPFYLGVVGALGTVGRLLGPYVCGHLYDDAGLGPVCTLTVVLIILALISFVIQHSLVASIVERRVRRDETYGSGV